MSKNTTSRNNYAVSEVIGGLLIIVIAVSSFFFIKTYAFPDLDTPDEIIDIKGYVTNDGDAVLEHVGGKSISSYKVELYDVEGNFIDSSSFIELREPWTIGKCIYPLEGLACPPLIYTSDVVEISLYIKNDDNNQQEIFNGILRGGFESSYVDPILISSLRTNTIVEDLICFNKTIESTIDPQSFIYKWLINEKSIHDILLPFDINSDSIITDYSGNENNGFAYGPSWNTNSVIGGCYNFDGDDDYISIPYCYDDSYIEEITVETWIKTDSDDLAIATFNRDEYWEICLKQGVIQWAMSVNGDTTEINGLTIVNDNNWHHICVKYNYASGNGSIFIDGILDAEDNCHDAGEKLGTGTCPTGFIGRSVGTPSEVSLFSSSFETSVEENKWYKDDYRTTAWWGYDFERFSDDSIQSRTGSFSLGGSGDFDPYFAAYNREAIDISAYEDVKVSVWYSYKSTESSDDVGFYYWDGSDWEAIFEDFSPYIGNDNQLEWTYAEVNIPNYIDDLILQFFWQTSSAREYFAIDDLTITGIPLSGGNNFSGYIDEFKIYNRALSNEQIYQNFLCSRNGESDKSIIVSQELSIGDSWKCTITPNNGIQDDESTVSNILEIIGYVGG